MKIVYTIKRHCHIVDNDSFNYTSFQPVKAICGKKINARLYANQDITSLSMPLCPKCEKRGYDVVLGRKPDDIAEAILSHGKQALQKEEQRFVISYLNTKQLF